MGGGDEEQTADVEDRRPEGTVVEEESEVVVEEGENEEEEGALHIVFAPNMAFPRLSTPLHAAAAEGRTDQLLHLLSMPGFNVDAPQILNRETPLHVAVQNEHKYSVYALIKAKANVEAQTSHGDTPLQLAIHFKNVEIVNVLLRSGAEVETRDARDYTPLHRAIAENSAPIVEELLKCKANLKAVQCENCFTCLHLAAANPDTNCMKILLRTGRIPPNTRSASGSTPLVVASTNGYVKMGRLLVRHKADPSIVQNDGRSCLHVASLNQNLAFTQWLLTLPETSLEAVTNLGQNAFHFAATTQGCCLVPLIAAAKAEKLVQLRHWLMAYNRIGGPVPPDVWRYIWTFVSVHPVLEAQDKVANTPLHYAAAAGLPRNIRHLLKTKVNPHVANVQGEIPVHMIINSLEYKGAFDTYPTRKKDLETCLALLGSRPLLQPSLCSLLRQPEKRMRSNNY